MTSVLATKQDILLIRQDQEAMRQQFRHLEELTSARMVMVALFALAGSVLAILR